MSQFRLLHHSILFGFVSLLCFAPQLALGGKDRLDFRLLMNSQRFLGFPYGTSPLGEGFGIDADPLIRFDTFDCTTFVETVMALSLAKTQNLQDVLETLNLIRYSDGKPHFTRRNHFTSLDWSPNNIRKGYLRDVITLNFPGAFRLRTKIDKKAWYQRNFGLDVEVQATTSFLNSVRIEDILKDESILQNVPNGTVVNFITTKKDLKSKIGTDLDIVHQGLLFWIDGQLVLRHARGVKYGVIEDSFIDYLKQSFELEIFAVNFLEILPISSPDLQSPTR